MNSNNDIKIDRVGKLLSAVNLLVYNHKTNPYMTPERAREILLEWARNDKEFKDADEYEKLFSCLSRAVLYQNDKLLMKGKC